MTYLRQENSYLLKKKLKKKQNGKKVLDIGCGSGIQARAALDSGAKEVLAADIDDETVEYCRKKGINTIKSDLFEKVKGKFDLIIFNPPYLLKDKREDKESARTTSGGNKGDEIIIRFLKEVKKHLNKNG